MIVGSAEVLCKLHLINRINTIAASGSADFLLNLRWALFPRGGRPPLEDLQGLLLAVLAPCASAYRDSTAIVSAVAEAVE